MATAQALKATHTVDDRVRVVQNKVTGVDDYVKAIDDKVALVIDGTQLSLISQQQNIVNSDVRRGKGDKGSHTTSRRRHRSSEKSAIFFSALTFMCRLNHSYRESITTGPSQMALSAGSLY
jgi:hypothetical protein